MSKYIEETADSDNVSIRAVTRILNISRSGFKSWKHRKKSHQQLYKERIKEMILTIYHESKKFMEHQKSPMTYGKKVILYQEKVPQ